MGGLRPWHLAVMLLCALVVALIVVGAVILAKRRPKP